MKPSDAAFAATGRRGTARVAAAALLVTALTALAYRDVASLGFVGFDDDRYVTDNAVVRQGLSAAGARWALTATENFNWHPLTWISHMLDVTLFGMDAGAHHTLNAAFHTANALLLLAGLYALTGALWSSATVAALFALHPLHVESVAWVSQRKDLLATLLGLLALLAYRRHARAPSPRRLLFALLPFALGLAAKPTLVTLPFTLLLLDYWPLNRLGAARSRAGLRSLLSREARTLWLEKTPFFLLAVLAGAATLYAQAAGGATRSMESFPLGARAANAAIAVVAYLSRTLLPRGLAVYYPFREDIGVLAALGAALLLSVATAAALRRRAAPATTVGWLWFLGTLLPVSGIVLAGAQAMADRYTYVPLVGIFLAATWGLRGGGRLPPRQAPFLGASLLLALALMSSRQVETWRTSDTLYRHALDVTTGNWLIDFNYAVELARAGRAPAAIEHFRRSLAAHPGFADAHTNLGALLHREGKNLEALEHLRRAVEIDPDSVQARMNLGIVLERLGRDREAAIHFQEAVRRRQGR